MLFSQARKRDVVNTTTATRVARVDGFVVLPGPARVALLRLGKVSGVGTLLSWEDLQGFGPDAVTVASDTVIRPARDAVEQRAEDGDLEIMGKRVLTERGMELGPVTDVDFDPETGEVTSLITKTDAISGRRLVGLGGYAVVVSA
ncbi:MAG: PRC-barrel domain-containing protein [Pseudonocardiales bacterium]|nr:PRC-barrel domain-containing protein [Pseudonocardiales bacterium]MBV9032724.1 PRC-barrel domain-containing protein [Pseudonocardiales bacterium]MBW0008683.1 PRC-barrel domain-containing protein [Pseudonocardiales bacterium]